MMQLHEILEENSTQAISKKTMISEENIELLLAEDFSSLTKAKAMGFISILERDFNADLSALKKAALTYYDSRKGLDESINIALPRVEERKERSKLFPLLMLGLLAYASWYFFTQFDKKTLGTLLPFGDNKLETSVTQVRTEDVGALSIDKALAETPADASGAQTEIVVASLEPKKVVARTTTSNTQEHFVSTSTKHRKVHALIRNRKIVLLPERKLWFGLIDIDTGKREHFSITKQYKIDVTKKSWLLATSPASFALINHNETQEYNDARAHYFKVSNTGVESLSKEEYVAQGGYKKW